MPTLEYFRCSVGHDLNQRAGGKSDENTQDEVRFQTAGVTGKTKVRVRTLVAGLPLSLLGPLL